MIMKNSDETRPSTSPSTKPNALVALALHPTISDHNHPHRCGLREAQLSGLGVAIRHPDFIREDAEITNFHDGT